MLEVLIYGLVDIKFPDLVKYVGKTKQKVSKRLHDHIRESYKHKTKKDIWIQSVLADNSKIEIKILEYCNLDNWKDVEIAWIDKLDGLTNISKGGDGGRGLLAVKTYDELKEFVRKNATNVRNSREWINFVINHPEFNFLPKCPSASYKNRGWISWKDFLMDYNGIESNRRNAFKKIFSYDEAKEFLKEMHIKSAKEFKNKVKALDNRIPSQPDEYYKKQNTWLNWADFLSNKNVYHKDKHFLSYHMAKDVLKKLNLKSANEYYSFIKDNKEFILPFNPDKFYKKQNLWSGWGDFLGKNS